MWPMKSYPILVEIHELRANGSFIKYDLGRKAFDKKTGKAGIKLKKRGHLLSEIPNEYLTLQEGKIIKYKHKLYLFSPSEDQYVAMKPLPPQTEVDPNDPNKIIINGLSFKVLPGNLRVTAVYNIQEAVWRNKDDSFLAKYGMTLTIVLILVGAGIFFFIIAISLNSSIEKLNAGLSVQSNSNSLLANGTIALTNAIEKVNYLLNNSIVVPQNLGPPR